MKDQDKNKQRLIEELERRVEERTAEVTEANQELQREIDQRKRVLEKFRTQQEGQRMVTQKRAGQRHVGCRGPAQTIDRCKTRK